MPRWRQPVEVPIPLRDDLRWPDPHYGPFSISLFFKDIDGRLEPIGISIFHLGAGAVVGPPTSLRVEDEADIQPIRATDLRRVPLATLVTNSRRRLSGLFNTLGRLADAAPNGGTWRTRFEELRNSAGAPPSDTRRSGRRGHGAAHYQQVAEVYLKAWEAGNDPTRAVATFFDVSKSAAGKWVGRARNQYHFLPPTERGVPLPRKEPS